MTRALRIAGETATGIQVTYVGTSVGDAQKALAGLGEDPRSFHATFTDAGRAFDSTQRDPREDLNTRVSEARLWLEETPASAS